MIELSVTMAVTHILWKDKKNLILSSTNKLIDYYWHQLYKI